MRALAYVYPKRFQFVGKDIDELSKGTRVIEHQFTSGDRFRLPIDLIRQFRFLLKAKTGGIRTVVAHFAGYHTMLPVLMGFDTYIIVAGSDSCSFPGIRYGSFRKRWMRSAMSLSMRKARSILPVDASLERFDNEYSDVGPVEQGYAHFVPGLNTPSIPIPYGFDMEFWKSDRSGPSPRSVLCVAFGAVNGDPVHFRKGVDLILEAALELTDHDFTIVGSSDVKSYSNTPSNVSVLGSVPASDLRNMFCSHSIILQASVMEGFPNALCEAMLCGCIPIVSAVTSMPSIVGDVGRVIKHRSVEELVNAIKAIDALSKVELEEQRKKARTRIQPFTMERRMEQLNAVLESDPAARS